MRNKKSIFLLVLICAMNINFIMVANLTFTGENQQTSTEFTLNLSAEQDLIEEWIRTWGGSGDDRAYAISLDSSENIYLAGYMNSFGVPYDSMLLVKYDQNGNQLWNRTWSDNPSWVRTIALDSSENIYLAGYNPYYSYTQVYLVKFNSAGDFQWNQTWSSCRVFGIAIDSFDNIYVTGDTDSYGTINNGIFLIKYNSSGDQQWIQTWDGDEIEAAFDIVIDSSNCIYVAGYTNSFGKGGYDMVLIKYNSSGELEWNDIWGTENNDRAWDIALDSSEDIFIKGQIDNDKKGLVKFNFLGNYLWNRTWAGSDTYPLGSGLAIDPSDNIYMLVNFRYLIKCNSSGDQLWNCSLTSGATLTAMVLDSSNNIYFAGYSSPAGSLDATLVKYSSKPKITIVSPNQATFFGKMAPSFELSIFEPDLSTTWYTLDGGLTNIPFTGLTGQIDQAEWDKIGHGNHTISFYANDTDGNMGFSEIEIIKDIEAPFITVVEPTPDSVYSDIPPNYSVYARDEYFYNNTLYNNLDSIWYTLDGGINIFTIYDAELHFYEPSGIINSNAWINAPSGNVTIQFYAKDAFGNEAFKNIVVEKRAENEFGSPGIHGYDILFSISIIWIISVILIKRLKYYSKKK